MTAGAAMARGRSPATRFTAALALLVPGVAILAGAAGAVPHALGGGRAGEFARQEPFVTREMSASSGGRWIGNAIAYGPHRDGQRPGGPAPTRAQVREDLRLMSRHWGLLRLYGAEGPAESVLAVIREDQIEMKVMLGVWIRAEQRMGPDGRTLEEDSEAKASNRREVEAAVRLAADHAGTILAVSVGNETQVSWSAHRVPADLLIGYLREVRARTGVPVTTADDFSFWKDPASRAVARETDFIATHLHPAWNGQSLAQAPDWTRRSFTAVQAAHPGHAVVIAECGWPTLKHDEGEQAKLIQGRLGEAEQKTFFDAFAAWAAKARVIAFFFEAFDENWKGGPYPDDVEKHWGLFRADRTPKQAVADGR